MNKEGSYYKLIDYFDVLGNEEDGWEVNNLCEVESEIFVADDATDEEILVYLKEIGYLTTSDPTEVTINSQDGQFIEIEVAKTGMPLGRLEKKTR